MSRPADRARAFACDRRGAAALEFAIVSPFIFASLFGVFEAGRAMYERNKVAAACAAAARVLEVKGADEGEAALDAIKARYKDEQHDRIDVDFEDETIDGVKFVKIEIAYEHDLLVKFGANFSGFTFIVTRYVPAM